jgi:excisionase family DNA binding protein
MESPGFEVTDEMVNVFGRAWAEADSAGTYTGTEGERRRAGLQAVLDMVNQPAEDGSCPMCSCPAPHSALWTVDEVATHFRVSNMTVYRMCHEGVLSAIRVGRSFRIPISEIARLARGAEALAPHEPSPPPGHVVDVIGEAGKTIPGYATSRKWWNE